jgi:hypothetical protein
MKVTCDTKFPESRAIINPKSHDAPNSNQSTSTAKNNLLSCIAAVFLADMVSANSFSSKKLQRISLWILLSEFNAEVYSSRPIQTYRETGFTSIGGWQGFSFAKICCTQLLSR